MIVRPLGEADREWVRETLRELWGETVVSRGVVHDPTALPGFVAQEAGERVGLLTYRVDGDDCEVVTIDAFPEGAGVRARRSSTRQRGPHVTRAAAGSG